MQTNRRDSHYGFKILHALIIIDDKKQQICARKTEKIYSIHVIKNCYELLCNSDGCEKPIYTAWVIYVAVDQSV
jgi:hypothetical protein